MAPISAFKQNFGLSSDRLVTFDKQRNRFQAILRDLRRDFSVLKNVNKPKNSAKRISKKPESEKTERKAKQ